jgi:hypothetical protein
MFTNILQNTKAVVRVAYIVFAITVAVVALVTAFKLGNSVRAQSSEPSPLLMGSDGQQ